MLLQENEARYTINSYVYHELQSGELVVQTPKSIVKTSNPDLKHLIVNWDQKSGDYIEVNKLKSMFKESYEDLMVFLLSNNIIIETQKPNFSINCIHFITNNNLVFSHLNNSFDDYDPKLKTKYTYLEEDTLSENIIGSNQLVVVFLNPYNKLLAKQLRDSSKENTNVHILLSYTYAGTFYMDALYNAELKTPCHLCHISYIEGNIRNSSIGNLTYQHMIDSILLEEALFNVEIPINKVKGLTISSLILNRVEKVIGLAPNYIEEFLQSISYDFDTKEILYDYPIHWELCDCYE